MKDFFISYTSADQAWAEWMAVSLSNAGHTLVIQAWDFLPGSNFVLQMQRATVECNRTIAVLSPDWLASVFTQPEWAAAFSLDPAGTNRKLIPVRVRLCEPPGLLRSIVYCDLIGLNEERARDVLLKGVREPGPRPSSAPFPAEHSPASSLRKEDKYPGVVVPAPPAELPSFEQASLALLGLLRTTRTTFVAQARLRDKLVLHLQDRLILNPYAHWEFEEFIAYHYKEMDEDEKRMFTTMRSFTSNVLRSYNRQILELVDQNPALAGQLPVVTMLKDNLLLWLAKYDGTFVNTPEMCLLYTGVNEGVPFPRELEAQLWRYFEGTPKAKGLLQVEPDSPLEFEEHSSSERNWQTDDRLFSRWAQRRFKELAVEREQVLAGSAGSADSETAEKLKTLDVEEAGLISVQLYPQGMWRPISRPEPLIAALRDLVDSAEKGAWPEALREALNGAIPIIDNPSVDPLKLKDLVLLLPVISAYVESLKI